jgi:hypothetical protein
MRTQLYVAIGAIVLGGIATDGAAFAGPSPSSSPDTKLCIQAFTETLAGHTVTTPEICIPVA